MIKNSRIINSFFKLGFFGNGRGFFLPVACWGTPLKLGWTEFQNHSLIAPVNFAQPAYWIFLFLVWLAWQVSKGKFWQQPWQWLFFSVVFYSFSEPYFFLFFVYISILDWVLGFWIEKNNRKSDQNKTKSKFCLIWSPRLVLGLLLAHHFSWLVYFKSQALGVGTLVAGVPLGVSFFLFQSTSYSLDLYRGIVPREKNLGNYLLYLCFFPQLVAGPIVPARDLLPQLKKPEQNIPYALALFFLCQGLAKKLVCADALAPLADEVYSQPLQFDQRSLWAGHLSYCLQIYCDFSGYTDIAQGSALLLGIRLPENFRMPYLASGFSEFWKRWHISLSTWLRNYLYIPLGGNRGGSLQTFKNLILVMGLGGLWHGLSFGFLFWGVSHGICLVVERTLGLRDKLKFIPKLLGWITTQTVVYFLWIPFRGGNFEVSLWVAQGHFVKNGDFSLGYQKEMVLLKILALVCFAHWLGNRYFSNSLAAEDLIKRLFKNPLVGFLGGALFSLAFVGILQFASESKTFLYFVF